MWPRSHDLAVHQRFTHAIARDEPMIRALARELCGRDLDVYHDLLQTGRIALWELVRRRATLPDVPYVRVVVRHRMLDWWRREHRARIIASWRSRSRVMARAA